MTPQLTKEWGFQGEGPYEAHAMLCVPKLLPDATKPEPAAAQEGAAGLYPKVQK